MEHDLSELKRIIEVGHAEINGRLDVGDLRMASIEKITTENAERGKQAIEKVTDLEVEIKGGKVAVNILSWFGMPALGLMAFIAYIKNGGHPPA